MQIKIAAIGKAQHISQLNQTISDYPEIEIIPFHYKTVNDAPELIDKAFMCDIYLFLEEAGFLAAKSLVDKKRLPVVCVHIDAYTVISNLYQAKTVNNHLPLDNISMDVPSCPHIQEMLFDLQCSQQNIYTYGRENLTDNTFDIDKIICHHEQLWKQGKISHVLTSIEEVHENLDKRDIPNHRMNIPVKNIKQAIETAISVTGMNHCISTQIVAANIKLKVNETSTGSGKNSIFIDNQKKLVVMLQKFAAQVDASIMDNQQLVTLIGTKALLDYLRNNLRRFPLLYTIEKEIRKPVAIGFGYGLTAKDASIHAALAMEKCEETQGSSCYIVNDREEVMGPLGQKKVFNTSKLYHALIHEARLNNELSYSFIDFINFRNNEPFSSQDIASHYQVTKRSAERTINKLLHGEVIKVVGKERPYTKGRPRKLFQMDI